MSASELESIDPCTGEVIWRGAAGDVDAAVNAARAALTGWIAAGLDARIAQARRFQDVVRDQADQFAALIATETGKPLWETRTEVASVIAKVDISLQAQAERAGERSNDAAGMRQALRHKPHGVLGVLGPYNFPAHLPNGHIVPALLAGNTIVFKPSELTPAVGEFMAQCWTSAGLPAGVLNVVQGAGDTGRALAGHAGLDGLLFTGSASTGALLARQFAETPWKMLALEMGGNNPLIVWDVEDSALDAAAALVVQSAYLSAGQRCTCARRLIVRDGAWEPLIDRVTALIDRIIVGAPFDTPQPFMGPVIDNRAADALQAGFAGLASRGGDVLRMLARRDMAKPLLSPGLIDVTDVADRPDSELFGPVLQMIRVADFDAARAEANNTRFGLSAGLIGGDAKL
ncbi:MAG: succinylglutamate-semialdehyde dehydrogenase, partial [Polymorphobacter sp.]